MTAADILDMAKAAGLRIRAEQGEIFVSPRSKLTTELRGIIRWHREKLLAVLDPRHVTVEEPTAGGTAAAHSSANCMGCANLEMRMERHIGTRRVFWWRCRKGYELLEGRNYGERVLLAPPQCSDFEQWQAGSDETISSSDTRREREENLTDAPPRPVVGSG